MAQAFIGEELLLKFFEVGRFDRVNENKQHAMVFRNRPIHILIFYLYNRERF